MYYICYFWISEWFSSNIQHLKIYFVYTATLSSIQHFYREILIHIVLLVQYNTFILYFYNITLLYNVLFAQYNTSYFLYNSTFLYFIRKIILLYNSTAILPLIKLDVVVFQMYSVSVCVYVVWWGVCMCMSD